MRRIFVAFTSVSEIGHGIPSLYLHTLFPRLRSQIGNGCHGISGGILRGVYESYLGHRIGRRVLEIMLRTTRRQLRQLYFCFFFSLKKKRTFSGVRDGPDLNSRQIFYVSLTHCCVRHSQYALRGAASPDHALYTPLVNGCCTILHVRLALTPYSSV